MRPTTLRMTTTVGQFHGDVGQRAAVHGGVPSALQGREHSKCLLAQRFGVIEAQEWLGR